MSDSDDLDIVPKTIDPLFVKGVAVIIRAALQGLSGIGVVWGSSVDDGQIVILASTIVFIGTVIWSMREKYKARKLRKAAATVSAIKSAEATASAGQPVAIVVPDPHKTAV